jgi:hypothetical protein
MLISFFFLLYVELGGLIVASVYIVALLFTPLTISRSVSVESLLLMSGH